MTTRSDNPDDSPEGNASERGGLIPGTRLAAFALTLRNDLPIPVLIAVPHSGRNYPKPLIERMRRADYSKLRLEDRFVDQVAEQVAKATCSGLLVARAPRAMLDLNRAIDDVDWDMIADAEPDKVRHSAANRRARSGLGLVPRRLPRLGEIWNTRMSGAELSARIRQVHAPYHAALASTLQQMRDKWGAVLLVDLHSMPPLKKAHPDDVPAQFVVGDRFGASANDRLVATALQYLADRGVCVAHNRPYAGGYVLDRHAAPARGIHAIQLEVCRSLYLDPDMEEVTNGLEPLALLIAGLVRQLGGEIAQMGRMGGMPIAAE